ncbi:MAG: hypothetical protein JW839_18420 [Candidatus Lokiarchaeota archaeon]|nr:hypothetical protein [Candidatus Lokiarchaeota archaeon]
MKPEETGWLGRLSFLVNAAAFFMLVCAAGYVLLASTATWCWVQGRWETVFATWAGIFGLITLVEVTAMRFHDALPAKIAMTGVDLGLGALVLMYYLVQEKAWCVDHPAWNQVIGIGSVASGVAAVCLNIASIAARQVRKGEASRRAWIAFVAPALACGLVIAGAGTNWFDPFYHARVPPRGEAPPTRFTFWSEINGTFTPQEWQSLDNHSATIVAYTMNRTFVNDTFSWAQTLRDTYPRIKLMWPLFGGYYNWEEIENDTSAYLDAIGSLNLNNTVGFVFDLERHNDTCWHDAARWQELQESMARCIASIKAQNAGYRIENTAGIWMLYSHYPLGGGDRTEVLFQHALMSLAGTADWDGYQWQLYRGNAVSPASDPDSTNMYERMLSSVRGVGADKTVPLFGMTGVGDYGPNNCSVDGLPCNLAGVVKDCRLARSLGIGEVGFYTLDSAGTWEGVYYPSMFEAYGADFLDVLNASVSGLDEPMVIDVPGNTAFQTTAGYYWEFAGYSIDGITVGIVVAVAVAAGLLLERRRSRPSRGAAGE